MVDQSVAATTIRNASLRWPAQSRFTIPFCCKTIHSVTRREVYSIELAYGRLIIHLGMTGRLRVLDTPIEPAKHDHIDICFNGGRFIRYNDTRRFGSVHWEPTGQPFSPDNPGGRTVR